MVFRGPADNGPERKKDTTILIWLLNENDKAKLTDIMYVFMCERERIIEVGCNA